MKMVPGGEFRHQAGFLTSLLCLCWLSACASPAAKIYTLASGGGNPGPGRPVSLSIETVDVAKYLDRPQLVRRSGAVQLGVSEFERWGEPLGSMIQRVLADDLRRRLPSGSVVTTSQTVSGREKMTLELAINRFDLDGAGVAVLQAQWTVHYAGGKAGPVSQTTITTTAAGSDSAAQVQALSVALDELASRIARRLG